MRENERKIAKIEDVYATVFTIYNKAVSSIKGGILQCLLKNLKAIRRKLTRRLL